MDLIASFLTGSILSWLLPIALLAVVCIWWAAILRRHPGGDA